MTDDLDTGNGETAKREAEPYSEAGCIRSATYEEVVAEVLRDLSPQAKAELRDMNREDLYLCHFSLGMYIRNKYIWAGSGVRGVAESCEAKGLITLVHPDDSMAIIEGVWDALRQGTGN